MAKNSIYDFPGGVIMTPPLDASMAFYPLDLQGLKLLFCDQPYF